MTLEELKATYYYDATSASGLRRNKDIRSGRKFARLMAAKGSVAGTLTAAGYWKAGKGSKMFCHRIVYAVRNNMELADVPVIDHEDQNKSNNTEGNLRPATRAINNRNKGKRRDNKTDVTGVNRKTSGNRNYLAVTWRHAGKVRNKYFSVDDLGYDSALKLAKDYRERKMRELNAEGAGYTARHGK